MGKEVKAIFDEFAKVYPYKKILQIVDYREKGLYVVFAVPKDQVQNRGKWLDGLHSVDMKTHKIVDGFQPLDNDPDLFFSLGRDRIIYQM